MYGGGGIFHHKFDSFFIVVVGAGFESVFDVLFKIIGFVEDRGYASLGEVGTGVDYLLFCNNQDLALFGCMEGKIQPRDAGADDEKICVHELIVAEKIGSGFRY